eukprot:CAMPEP_0115476120 /NCGR_PEP_ID=MMETSP0271-20121206/54969_1 /TAXON_ID=71861 /ORGANISM="Scrippsiella trochoidea, Strain CCMP3099" /LENGTH=81 /DNA_ID=CAMNT_0002903515 /DNA_START=495 /DNA_END=736 /DNA_ORIENTATION=+
MTLKASLTTAGVGPVLARSKEASGNADRAIRRPRGGPLSAGGTNEATSLTTCCSPTAGPAVPVAVGASGARAAAKAHSARA